VYSALFAESEACTRFAQFTLAVTQPSGRVLCVPRDGAGQATSTLGSLLRFRNFSNRYVVLLSFASFRACGRVNFPLADYPRRIHTNKERRNILNLVDSAASRRQS
jgi:hypothetical protein